MVQFERESWKEFRTLDGLCRMAGVSRNRIVAVVAKELVDNALDESPVVDVGLLGNNGFFVQDGGPGIDPAVVAEPFSIKRSQQSTKFLRLPTRGALGNGLRVVASAVLCTQGQLIVSSRNQVMKLTPKDDGSTSTEIIGNYEGAGARVEVWLGKDTGVIDNQTLQYANIAIRCQHGTYYTGKTSGYWYTSRDLYELFNAATDEEMTVRPSRLTIKLSKLILNTRKPGSTKALLSCCPVTQGKPMLPSPKPASWGIKASSSTMQCV